MEEAGADALELNIYFVPTDPEPDARRRSRRCITELVANVNSSVRIPLAVKMAPYFSSFGNMALQLEMAGANGLVMFNRFYQPDFDLESLEVVPNLQFSRSNELRLRLPWVALLYGRIKADMAITGGVHTAEDVVKCMMAGAKVAMMTSALLEHGIGYLRPLMADLSANGWRSTSTSRSQQMQGSMSAEERSPNPAAFERANYIKVLSSYAVESARQVKFKLHKTDATGAGHVSAPFFCARPGKRLRKTGTRKAAGRR